MSTRAVPPSVSNDRRPMGVANKRDSVTLNTNTVSNKLLLSKCVRINEITLLKSQSRRSYRLTKDE